MSCVDTGLLPFGTGCARRSTNRDPLAPPYVLRVHSSIHPNRPSAIAHKRRGIHGAAGHHRPPDGVGAQPRDGVLPAELKPGMALKWSVHSLSSPRSDIRNRRARAMEPPLVTRRSGPQRGRVDRAAASRTSRLGLRGHVPGERGTADTRGRRQSRSGPCCPWGTMPSVVAASTRVIGTAVWPARGNPDARGPSAVRRNPLSADARDHSGRSGRRRPAQGAVVPFGTGCAGHPLDPP